MNGENTDGKKNPRTITFDTGEEVVLDTTNIDLTQKSHIEPGGVAAPELFDAFIAGYKTSLQHQGEDSEQTHANTELRETLENDFTDWMQKHINEEN